MDTRREEGACRVSYQADVYNMVKVGNKAMGYGTLLQDAWAVPLEPIREEGAPSWLDGGERRKLGYQLVGGNEGPSSCLAVEAHDEGNL